MSDDAFEKRAERWPESTPDTKEAYFIRDIFDSPSFPLLHNPNTHLTARCAPPLSSRRSLPTRSSCCCGQVRSSAVIVVLRNQLMLCVRLLQVGTPWRLGLLVGPERPERQYTQRRVRGGHVELGSVRAEREALESVTLLHGESRPYYNRTNGGEGACLGAVHGMPGRVPEPSACAYAFFWETKARATSAWSRVMEGGML